VKITNKEIILDSMNENPWFLNTRNKTKILTDKRPLIFFKKIS
jgi:hypothetical protein